jgi:hypothetical protein
MLCDSDIDASFVDHAFQELYSDDDEAGRIKRWSGDDHCYILLFRFVDSTLIFY